MNVISDHFTNKDEFGVPEDEFGSASLTKRKLKNFTIWKRPK